MPTSMRSNRPETRPTSRRPPDRALSLRPALYPRRRLFQAAEDADDYRGEAGAITAGPRAKSGASCRAPRASPGGAVRFNRRVFSRRRAPLARATSLEEAAAARVSRGQRRPGRRARGRVARAGSPHAARRRRPPPTRHRRLRDGTPRAMALLHLARAVPAESSRAPSRETCCRRSCERMRSRPSGAALLGARRKSEGRASAPPHQVFFARALSSNISMAETEHAPRGETRDGIMVTRSPIR